ncbi:hypothetical protein [Telmatospirillum sp. J64-1]|uniref:hypothetical protein n=1 Tax=Telmatospirillum sp. J64-1 TaxID=2502183 RepID=UPI00115CCCE0|nr:hypothetical protein [Telmatospirillum sp. J64-1]
MAQRRNTARKSTETWRRPQASANVPMRLVAANDNHWPLPLRLKRAALVLAVAAGAISLLAAGLSF